MKKNVKTILKTILLIVIAIIVIFLGIKAYYMYFNSDNNELTTEDTDILLLTKTYPTTFYFIGNAVSLDQSIATENITIDEVSNIKTSKKQWAMIVFNDLEDNTPINEEQWKSVVDTVKNNNHINCMYLGNSDLDIMEQQGYFSGKDGLDDTDLSMGLIHHKTSVINTLGMLNKGDDIDNLPTLLIHEQAYDLQTSK